MIDVATGLPPAAWYPDPGEPDILRWWDGSSWSTHTMMRPETDPGDSSEPEPASEPEPEPPAVPVVPVVSAPAVAPLPPVLHKVPEPQQATPEPPRSIPEPMPFASGVALGSDRAELRTSELPMLSPIERAARAEIYARLSNGPEKEAAPTGFDPSRDFDPALFVAPVRPVGTFGTPPPVSNPFDGDPAPTGTPAAWLLALSPWITSGLSILAIYEIANSGSRFSPITGLISLVLGVLSFVVAHRDVVALRQRGYQPASIWWLLLGVLIYLIARTVDLHRGGGRSAMMIVVFVLSAVVSTVALGAWLYTAGLPLLMAASFGMQ